MRKLGLLLATLLLLSGCSTTYSDGEYFSADLGGIGEVVGNWLNPVDTYTFKVPKGSRVEFSICGVREAPYPPEPENDE